MKNYYIVIGAFVGVCVLSVLYVLLNPKKSFAQMPVIDDTAILVHNGQQGTAFQRGENQFFQVCESYTNKCDVFFYRTGPYLTSRLCSEILCLTLPMSLLASLVRKMPMRSSLKSSTGERNTPSVFKTSPSRAIAPQHTQQLPYRLWPIAFASRSRSQCSSRPKRSSVVTRVTTDARVVMSLALSAGASARVSSLSSAIPLLAPRELAKWKITLNPTSADKTVFSIRSLITASLKTIRESRRSFSRMALSSLR